MPMMHVAAHQAAEKARREEETMTAYTPQDVSEEWEFKILRSAGGAFRNPAAQARAETEEALAGWALLEKFDNDRLRFKRPVSARRKDGMLPPGVDPYRTTYGMSEGALAFWVIGGLLVLGLLLGWVGSLF